jgi:hypothetical protein
MEARLGARHAGVQNCPPHEAVNPPLLNIQILTGIAVSHHPEHNGFRESLAAGIEQLNKGPER